MCLSSHHQLFDFISASWARCLSLTRLLERILDDGPQAVISARLAFLLCSAAATMASGLESNRESSDLKWARRRSEDVRQVFFLSGTPSGAVEASAVAAAGGRGRHRLEGADGVDRVGRTGVLTGVGRGTTGGLF